MELPRRRRNVLPEHFNPDVVMEDTETAAPDSSAAGRDRNLADREEELPHGDVDKLFLNTSALTW